MAVEEPNWPEPQFTEEQAIEFAESGKWKELSLQERAELQINQRLLSMPFDAFHEAIEHALSRPVYTHEFGLNWKGLQEELFEGRKSPTLTELLDMFPGDKPLLVVSPE